MSTLALQDLRWRSRRSPAGGPPTVSAGFIESVYDQRMSTIVGGILAYFVSLTRMPRHAYDPDVPVEIAGDRRLGHALATVCGDWYRWATPGFDEALPAAVAAALARADLDTPSALRLRLFDRVNESEHGFVPVARRDALLATFARELGLGGSDAPLLEQALTLDAEREAILVAPEHAPSVADVVARYNRAVLAALLRHATRIVVLVAAPSGTLIRRLYAICRRLGIYCDVERADPGEGFRLTLAGPDAIVGPPAAAGPRLASVSVRLLQQLGRDDNAVADLVLHERPCRLQLTPSLLRLPGLGQNPEEGEPIVDDNVESGSAPADLARFDSDVEARLASDFGVLQRQGRAAGWWLVREPAPLLAGGRVLLPDFALERDDLRVFVEVAGFWTPGYLAKKRAALDRLAPETPLILAVAPPAAAALAGVPFPLIPYKNSVAVDTLLTVAESRFGDFAARTAGAQERLLAACGQAAASGWIGAAELAAVLRCHSSAELLRLLVETPLPAGWRHVPGAGLCGPVLRNRLSQALAAAWQGEDVASPLTLPDLHALLKAAAPLTAHPDDDASLLAVVESLGVCRVTRGSLFDLELQPFGTDPPLPVEPEDPRSKHTPAARRPRARPRRAHPSSLGLRLD